MIKYLSSFKKLWVVHIVLVRLEETVLPFLVKPVIFALIVKNPGFANEMHHWLVFPTFIPSPNWSWGELAEQS